MPSRRRRAPLTQNPLGVPLQRVTTYILGPFPVTDRGNKYILLVGDYFTRWMEGYAIPNQETTTVADKILNEFVCRFDSSTVAHSDRGSNFESVIFREVCQLLQI